jgi:hypothetical protein
LELAHGKKMMLRAEKIMNSATSHYKITIETAEKYMKSTENVYLGRLRGNFGNSQFYIFDNGVNPKEAKKIGKFDTQVRKQFGTIIYSDKDKLGKKVPRNIDIYMPMIPKDCVQILTWQDIPEKKKQFIPKEYELQKAE